MRIPGKCQVRVGKRKDETMADNGESKDTGSVC